MRSTFTPNDGLLVELDDSNGLSNNNSDTYTFTISTRDCQHCCVDGKDVESFTFSLCGNWELNDFFEAMDAARALIRARSSSKK